MFLCRGTTSIGSSMIPATRRAWAEHFTGMIRQIPGAIGAAGNCLRPRG